MFTKTSIVFFVCSVLLFFYLVTSSSSLVQAQTSTTNATGTGGNATTTTIDLTTTVATTVLTSTTAGSTTTTTTEEPTTETNSTEEPTNATSSTTVTFTTTTTTVAPGPDGSCPSLTALTCYVNASCQLFNGTCIPACYSSWWATVERGGCGQFSHCSIIYSATATTASTSDVTKTQCFTDCSLIRDSDSRHAPALCYGTPGCTWYDGRCNNECNSAAVVNNETLCSMQKQCQFDTVSSICRPQCSAAPDALACEEMVGNGDCLWNALSTPQACVPACNTLGTNRNECEKHVHCRFYGLYSAGNDGFCATSCWHFTSEATCLQTTNWYGGNIYRNCMWMNGTKCVPTCKTLGSSASCSNVFNPTCRWVDNNPSAASSTTDGYCYAKDCSLFSSENECLHLSKTFASICTWDSVDQLCRVGCPGQTSAECISSPSYRMGCYIPTVTTTTAAASSSTSGQCAYNNCTDVNNENVCRGRQDCVWIATHGGCQKACSVMPASECMTPEQPGFGHCRPVRPPFMTTTHDEWMCIPRCGLITNQLECNFRKHLSTCAWDSTNSKCLDNCLMLSNNQTACTSDTARAGMCEWVKFYAMDICLPRCSTATSQTECESFFAQDSYACFWDGPNSACKRACEYRMLANISDCTSPCVFDTTMQMCTQNPPATTSTTTTTTIEPSFEPSQFEFVVKIDPSISMVQFKMNLARRLKLPFPDDVSLVASTQYTGAYVISFVSNMSLYNFQAQSIIERNMTQADWQSLGASSFFTTIPYTTTAVPTKALTIFGVSVNKPVIAALGCLSFIALGIVLYLLWKRKKKQQEEESMGEGALLARQELEMQKAQGPGGHHGGGGFQNAVPRQNFSRNNLDPNI